VAPFVSTNSDEQTVELANTTEFGLIAYVYFSYLKLAIKVAECLESRMVEVNKGVIPDLAVPFGRFKQSGLGRKGGFA
jgi:succinate-semialdehyde dehydrogenase/glutarate-semialdehyde dehydrogenase